MQALLRTVLIVSFFLSAIAHADAGKDYLECSRYLQGVADEHLEEANQIRSDHQREFDKRVQKIYRHFDDDRARIDVLKRMIETTTSLHDIETVRVEYVDEVISTLQNYGDADDDDFECLSEQLVRNRVFGWQHTYESRLEQLRRDVYERFDLEKLDDDEGLVVIAFYAFGYAERIRIDRRGSLLGSIEFGPVKNGEYFRVIRAKAGEYSWDEVSRQNFAGRFYHDYSKRDFNFSVVAGKLNYTGVFVYDAQGNRARGSLNDRTSIVLTKLERRFPGLIERFEIANGLVPEDRFIEYYLSEKRRVEQVSGDE